MHGLKEIMGFKPFLETDQAFQFVRSTLPHRMGRSKMILYDQEPIESNVIIDSLKSVFTDYLDPDLHYIVEQSSFAQLTALWLPNASFPIWCTSEYKGQAIEELKRCYFIPCSYWYHAFIARDWYRHYQHWPHLDVSNKTMHFKFLMYARDDTGSREYRKTVKQNLAPLANDILHDWHGQHHVSADWSALINAEDAQKSAVHLVLETQFDTDTLYLTEKIFKPMVMNQAFIAWAPAGALRFLRSRGFRTFEGIWSEDYDCEEDAGKRMDMLIDLVRDLTRLDQHGWQQIWLKCLPIIDHNRRWFFSESFMQACWQELADNVRLAKLERQELLTRYPGGQLLQTINDCPDFYKLPSRRSMVKQYLADMDPDAREKIKRTYSWLTA